MFRLIDYLVIPMPVILWFLGVPLALVVVLMVLGVVSF